MDLVFGNKKGNIAWDWLELEVTLERLWLALPCSPHFLTMELKMLVGWRPSLSVYFCIDLL